MNIEGQSVIVTGAASGMGAATAQYLTKAGARVALLDLNSDQVEEKAAELGAVGVGCDVSDSDSASAAVAAVVSANGPPRVLVNCAGIATGERIVGRDGPMPLENFSRVINVNLIGTFNMIRLVANEMFAQEPMEPGGERGVIVNTASVAAYEGQIGQAAYAASKGGVVALTIQAAREFASKGVRVMTIAPGLIATPMLMGMPQEVQDSLAASVPFPQRLGDPVEYARLVEHICQNEMLNGDVIRLDGAIRLAPR